MNINCLICTDIFTPSSDIYTIPCGHIFHYHCLLHWLENSKTCPQCRAKVTTKSLVRLYVNVASSEGIEGNSTVLQHKVDGLEFQLRLKETDIKNFAEKYKTLEEQNKALRMKVKELELGEVKHESVRAALKDQIKFFKQKSLSFDKLQEEINRLKGQIKDLEHVQAAVNGSKKQVEDIIRNENSVESLALLAATLKRTLVDTEGRKRQYQIELKRAQNEVSLQKREIAKIKCEYEDTKKQLEYFKVNHQKESAYLKNKLAQLQSNAVLNESAINTIRNVTSESPVNFSRTPVLNSKKEIDVDLTESPVNFSRTPVLHSKKAIDVDLTESPISSSSSVPDLDKIKTIRNKEVNNSPLPATSMGVLAIQRAKMTGSLDPNKFSIFKHKPLEPPSLQSKKSKDSLMSYDGFGGSCKDDIFPIPHSSSEAKRRKITKTKKLSADAGKLNRKMTSYLS